MDLVVLRSRVEHPEVAAGLERAWDLDAIAQVHEEFLDPFRDRAPENDQECFLAWTALAHAWRSCVMADPRLPAGALRPGWPRERAYALATERRGCWHASADACFGALTQDAGSSWEMGM